MTFPRVARYTKVMMLANKFFIDQGIHTFPLDPFEIIQNNKWGLITYSELAEDHGVSIDDIINAFQSEDGYTVYDGTNYTIAYNDTILVPGRIRFTLMHEIGHIYLRHLVEFDETILTRSSLTERKYKVLENETNSFARNILAPVMIVKDLKIKTVNDLVDYFGLSQSASVVRLRAVNQDYMNLLAPFIKLQRDIFQVFMHICLHSKLCLNCSKYFVDENAEYCPICGMQVLINRKGVELMIYKGHLVDDYSRALICPKCENEDINYAGDICKICGTDLVNKCVQTYQTDDTGWVYKQDSCEALLDGDARYCTRCGNESSFYRQGLLKSWQEEKEEYEIEEKEEILF